MKTMTAGSITVAVLADDWARSLRTGNKSPRTLETYMEGVHGLDRFLAERGMPQAIEGIKREHVEAFIVDLLERWTPATASNRYRSLQQFFKWAVAQGEITESPMKNMTAPKLPERHPPVLTLEDFDALIATCTGNGFTDRPDTALLWLLRDTGARSAEIMNLMVADVDRDDRRVRLIGKEDRERVVRYWPQTEAAIDRYLRSRRQHEYRTWMRSGSVKGAHWARVACGSCLSVGGARPAWRTLTRIDSAICLPING